MLLSYRLGGGESDAEEIKSHVFFESINWDDVYHKRIPPERIPVIWSEKSTDYFEKKFTDQNPELTPPDESMLLARLPSIFIIPFSSGSFDDYGGQFKDFDFVASNW